MRAAHPLKGVLLLVCAISCFTVLDAVAKHLSASYPVPMIVWARYFFHVALMVLLFAPRMGTRLVRTKRPGLQLMRGALLGLSSVFFFFSLSYLPLADAAAITSIAPILVTALAVRWLGERAPSGAWWALAVSFSGVLLIVRPGSSVFSWAALLPVLTAFCFASYQLLTRRLSGVDDGMATLFLGGLVSAVIMSLVVPAFWTMPRSAIDAAVLVATGAIGAFGHMLLVRAFDHAPATLLAPFGYTQLVAAIVVGWLVFGNFPDGVALFGMALIVASGVTMAVRQGMSVTPRAPSSAPAPVRSPPSHRS